MQWLRPSLVVIGLLATLSSHAWSWWPFGKTMSEQEYRVACEKAAEKIAKGLGYFESGISLIEQHGWDSREVVAKTVRENPKCDEIKRGMKEALKDADSPPKAFGGVYESLEKLHDVALEMYSLVTSPGNSKANFDKRYGELNDRATQLMWKIAPYMERK
jgi:hypothetical protein